MAPYFRVQSGDDKELTLDMIKGKVAAIVIEDKSRRIRVFTSGEVKAEEINDVQELLKVLAGEYIRKSPPWRFSGSRSLRDSVRSFVRAGPVARKILKEGSISVKQNS